MQTWAKRGLQTALVTGGLLMLGTGIASADEDVNPDKPASPLDGSVTVPVHMDNNVLGTPFGQKAVPAVHRDITFRGSDITDAIPADRVASGTDPIVAKAAETAAPVVNKAQDAVAPLPRDGRDFAAPVVEKAKPVTGKLESLPVVGDKLPPVSSLDKVSVPDVDRMGGTPAQGNQANLDMVVPVDVSGNAVAVLGRAETTNESHHGYGWNHDVEANGSGRFVGGNVVDLDWALPVQVTNNAVAAVGRSSAEGTTTQEAWATGDIDADGSHSFLGGNVIAPQFATPVQVDGNAVAGGGWADAGSEASTSADAGGSIRTTGADSIGGGNAVPVPVAVPARVNGNAIMGLGDADAWAHSTADASAGATRTGMYGVPTYVQTNGDPALAAGNIVQPAASGPAMLCGNAGGAGGEATAACQTATTTEAGGTSRTTGHGAVASGAIAALPVALPVQGFGNAAAGVGDTEAVAANTVDSTAGGDSYTRGHDSVVSGSTANAPVAGTVDVFANSVAAAGAAESAVTNDAAAEAGGHTGTTGDDSLVGGNMVTSPVSSPTELYGNSAAGLGAAEAVGAETKTVSSGGGNNTDDDYGVVASNLVHTPVATAAQAFGNSAGAVAFTDAAATADNEVTAGGDSNATGTAGLGSGNIGQVPVSVPFQVFGTGASGLAKGTQAALNETDMRAGGDATSDGTHGAGAGNVVTAPVAGAVQAFGESAAVLGLNHSLAASETETKAGGDTETSGHSGLLSGNVASPQALPIAQSFAAVASAAGGINSSSATNATEAESGGDIDTTGDRGYLSGNLLDVPTAAAVQPFGDALAVLSGRSYAQGLSATQGLAGGTSTTSGRLGSLSGIDGTLPIGVNAPVYDVPVEVLAQAMTEAVNNSDLQVGDAEPQLHLPVSGGMSPTELPTFAPQRSAPEDDFRGVFTGVLGRFAHGMTWLLGQDHVTDVANLVAPAPQILPARGDVPVTLPAPDVMPQTPALPVSGDVYEPLPTVTLDTFDRSRGARSDVPSDLTDVTTLIPAIPATDELTDITTVMPVIPAPGLEDISSAPVVQAPSVGHLPVPAVSDVQTPELGGSSLDSTRAALANLFTTHPIA
ncbi:beta strand repeat-containing protein [Actinophytocola sp. NPDC049390]|uniref:beta strand repeat-containing protein n=1 Tax=Actinophytocola sp. NPDC049390 TaxID=3363894 RepID=UPI0037A6D743